MASQLGFFRHHPDPSTDFCVEVEAVEGMAWDACIFLADGLTTFGSENQFWGHLSRALRWSGQAEMSDEYMVRARAYLLTFERRFFAGEFSPRRTEPTPTDPEHHQPDRSLLA